MSIREIRVQNMPVLTSIVNPKIKLVRALQSQRKGREKERRFVIEGVRLVEEAVRAKARIDFVLFTGGAQTQPRA